MALNYITLVLDLADGTGTPLATGQALLNPSAQLTDATDDMIVTKAQLSAKLAGSYPQARPGSGQSCSASTATTSLLISCTG
jgi:hypothetical protein